MTQFHGLVASPKWTNPMPNTTALPSAAATSTAIGPSDPHGGNSTTPATHPTAKRHRPERLSIRSNSPSIAWPQSTRSAGTSPTAHCNNRSGPSRRAVCVSGGGCSRLHSTAPAPLSSKIARTEGRPPPISSNIARTGPLRPAQTQAPVRHGSFAPGGVERRHVLPPRRSESIQVSGRPAEWTWFPRRFEHLTVGQSDQDGIERTRLQVDFGGQVVAVAPLRRMSSQCLEDSDHLRRWTP